MHDRSRRDGSLDAERRAREQGVVQEKPQLRYGARGPRRRQRFGGHDAPGEHRVQRGGQIRAAGGLGEVAGVREGSNVDAAGMLVSMIELARQFEMQVRVLQSGDETARMANTLLSTR